MKNMKGALKRSLYPVLILIATIFIAVMHLTKTLELKEIAVGLLGLISTYFGATIAFALNEHKESQSLHEARRRTLNMALFIISRQLNAMHLIRRDMQKYETDLELAFNMPAFTVPDYQDLVQDLSALQFIIEVEDEALKILFALVIEQERFQQALTATRSRNKFHYEQLQPVIEREGINGRGLGEEGLVKALGQKIFFEALNNGKIMREHVNGFCKSAPVIANALKVLAGKLYPDHKFISVVFDE